MRMCDVRVCSPDVELSDAEKRRITNRAYDATKVFDVRGSVCEVTIEKAPSRSKEGNFACGVCLSLPRSSMYARGFGRSPEDAAADALAKSTRQLRRHKTQVCEKWKRHAGDDDDVDGALAHGGEGMATDVEEPVPERA